MIIIESIKTEIYSGGRVMNINESLTLTLGKKISDASDEEIYAALVKLVNDYPIKKNSSKKKLYYISAEFLIGRLLIDNMMKLGIYDEVKKVLEENGKNIDKIECIEPEPSLGNGGLGRLAACFMDSAAELGLNADGVGLNYHFGLFRQFFKGNKQEEEPNPWIKADGFLRKTEVSYEVGYLGHKVKSVMYDIDIIGKDGYSNTLHLFDSEETDEGIVKDGTEYDKTDIEKNLTLFLYPDDSTPEGKKLRIYQEYFMVSNAAQLILDECVSSGSSLYDLCDYAVIQINDTHPTMIIPELIRLMIARGQTADAAVEAVKKSCAYTNHTILAEALETWPLEDLKSTVPQLVPIIEILDNKVRKKFPDKSVYIIDDKQLVHMANIDIHYGKSVNGVAELHTDILKNSELNNFYRIYPEKFNNKTNGITFRRWLYKSNPQLTALIDKLIGTDYKEDSEKLTELMKYAEDGDVICAIEAVKEEKKKELCDYLKNGCGFSVNEGAVFDIQAKRFHEYKRQQMNALYYIGKYLDIKKGNVPKRPITAIFAGKAAPAYTIAKDIIHMILCLGEVVRNDNDVNKYLQIIMPENYNVTMAEKLVPACDLSEQISLASKEASGTGNMKFMLNGSVTIGTEDGANVEIHRLVGDDNIYIFGDKSETVIERYEKKSYKPSEYYENDEKICEAVNFITGKQMLAAGDKESLERLKDELITKDWFMTFPDFEAYAKTKEKAFSDYENRDAWGRKMLVNISNAGYFSSDRTIKEYNREIWKL